MKGLKPKAYLLATDKQSSEANMKIGFIISMYDEIEQVNETIKILKVEKYPIIVIQSDPQNNDKILEKTKVDHYELLSDLAGTKEKYMAERSHMEKGTTIPSQALTRNYSKGFTASKNFDAEWWVAILGDVAISNLRGIKKIIEKMTDENKSIGITRAVGQIFPDDNFDFTRIQRKNTTDMMPQFFIVNSDLVKKGLFNNVKITNRWASEQCFGDDILRVCNENSLSFFDTCYFICDYAYPKFIEGLKYNPVQARLPRYVDGIINAFRRIRVH